MSNNGGQGLLSTVNSLIAYDKCSIVAKATPKSSGIAVQLYLNGLVKAKRKITKLHVIIKHLFSD